MNFISQKTNLNQDPIKVFEQLAGQHEYCFLLETLADKFQPQTSGQSYIGIAPTHKYAAKQDKFITDGVEEKTSNPYETLRNKLKMDQTLPAGYTGGLVGYFSHEAIHFTEPSLKFKYPREFYDFEFAQYDDGLIFRPNQPTEYFHYDVNRLSLYSKNNTQKQEVLSIEYVGAHKDFNKYEHMIDKAREDIQNGRVFQVVLANKFEYKYYGDLLKLYKELRQINPSPFMFFMKFGNIITLGASPELLAHTNPDHKVYLEALAGTIRRGKNDKEDSELAELLLSDEKEIAEHNMLVDLARNDVGRISKIGSVQIDDLRYVKKLSHVQHISSIISGTLADDKDAFDALASSFPAGTLSGAPKIEAIKMINELEGYERGPYAGTIGYFSYNGDSVHAVNIRSVHAINSKLYMQTGSGIVFDSRAQREYQEVGEKKAAMDKAMEPFLSKSSEGAV